MFKKIIHNRKLWEVITALLTGFLTYWNVRIIWISILTIGQSVDRYFAWQHAEAVLTAFQWIFAVIGGSAIWLDMVVDRLEEEARYKKLARWNRAAERL
jgi:hypothetical protein